MSRYLSVALNVFQLGLAAASVYVLCSENLLNETPLFFAY